MRKPYTLTKVNNIWYYLTYDMNGKRRRFSTGQITKSAAHAHCMDLLRNDALIPNQIKKMTFLDFSEPFWIWETCPIVTDKIERGYRYSQTLCRNNRGSMEKNIIPTFGKYYLSDITPDMVNRWLLGLRHPRKVRGKVYKPLANSTANKMHNMLKDMLEIALRRNLITSNPATGVHKLADNYKVRGCYTVQQARLILSDKDEWNSPLAWLGSYTAALTGMRMGEIRALKREDIKDDHIVIQHSIDRTIGIKSTKTAKTRHVPIPSVLRNELLFWAPENGFIFSLDGGTTPVNPDYLLENLYRRMEDLEIDYKTKRLTFHSWRHFFNTRLIASGVQGEITRAVVGHESEDMTERYLHLTAGDMHVVSKVQEELVRVVG